MGGGRSPGCGTLVAILLGGVAVLYYGFHMTSLGWILKLAFVIFALIVLGIIAVVVWLVRDSQKEQKAAEEEKAKKAAEKSLRRIQESRAARDKEGLTEVHPERPAMRDKEQPAEARQENPAARE